MRFFIRKILAHILAFLGATAALGLLLLLITPQYSQGYNASIIDKMARLRSIRDPKIILVGDSNLAYGMDSAYLEEQLGMPVVNLGLHGGLGNEFHARMLLGEIRQGDIIVISFTSYGDGKLADPELAWITIEDHFDLWHIIPPSSWPEMIRALPKYAGKACWLCVTGKGNLPSGDSYQRSAFDRYGDVAYDRPDGAWEKTGARHTGLPGVSSAGTRSLNRLCAACYAAGATVFLAAYPVMDDGHAPAPAEFAEKVQLLRSQIDCPFISDFGDYYFPPEVFYNTAYHMTSHGAHLRAVQLAKDLAAAMKEKQSP